MDSSGDKPINKLHECVAVNDILQLKNILNSGEADIESPDEFGTSLLSVACHHGNKDLVTYLIALGADVNSYSHKDRYTPLFFASIAGHLEIVEILLENGARVSDQNKLNRTASDVAGFVGNYRVVSLLNNYIPSTDLHRFTKPNGINGITRLNPILLKPLHKIINSINISPLFIMRALSKNFQDNPEISLLRFINSIANNVLSGLLSDYFTPHNTIETIAVKLHLIKEIFLFISTYFNEIRDTLPENKAYDPLWPLGSLAKKVLRCSETSWIPICELNEEKFFRKALASFPHVESMFWRQLISTCAQIEPTTLNTPIRQVIMAQINCKGFAYGNKSDIFCACCGETGDGGANPKSLPELNKCSACKMCYYCDSLCQKVHWVHHKKFCILWRKQNSSTDK